jgi:hypothetical protein
VRAHEAAGAGEQRHPGFGIGHEDRFAALASCFARA